MGNAFFIAGTDTDAGKTVAALSLCRALCERGLKIGVFKSAESTSDEETDLLVRETANAIIKVTEN